MGMPYFDILGALVKDIEIEYLGSDRSKHPSRLHISTSHDKPV
jgi:hypothetical protein